VPPPSPSPSPDRRPVRAERARLVRVLLGYLAVPLLNAVSPLLALPAITAVHGGGAWVAVAIGQSVGGAAGVVVELGWGMAGTQRAARQAPRNQARAFALSLVTKAIIGVPVIIAACTVAALLAPQWKADAALVAAAAVLGMFTGGWIFIGTMRARLFLFTEVLPRAALIALSAVVIAAGGALVWYSGALLLASVGATIAGAIVLRVRPGDFLAVGPRRCFRVVAMQGNALATNVFSSLYISLGLTVATVGSPNSSLLYASMDRLLRMTQQVMSAQNRLMKGWVGRVVDPKQRIARARRAVLISSAAGAGFGIAFAAASPFVADLVFSGTVHVPVAAALIGGTTVFVVCTSMSTGFVLLVSLGRLDAVARSAFGGALIGVPAIYFGSVHGGGTGALAGQLTAETVVLAIQLIAIAIESKRRAAPATAQQPV
jgi:hypothetical protein